MAPPRHRDGQNPKTQHSLRYDGRQLYCLPSIDTEGSQLGDVSAGSLACFMQDRDIETAHTGNQQGDVDTEGDAHGREEHGRDILLLEERKTAVPIGAPVGSVLLSFHESRQSESAHCHSS